jgi:3-isopropylmalate/(R)-2-methylmalate dehydratase small subunit
MVRMKSSQEMVVGGRAWRFGDNVNTDEIIPARYLNVTDSAVLARHCMEGVDGRFASSVQPGDVIVGGRNFGCGSSREHAPLCIKAAGVSCVISATFARIFYRNAINMGLPILECAEASEKVQEGDSMRVDLGAGMIENLTRVESYRAAPFPDFMREIIRSGGLMNWAMAHMAGESP